MNIILLLAVTCAWADDRPPDQVEESARRAEIVKVAAAKAKSVEVVLVGDEASARLREKPLLSWSNPTIGSIYGEVFLWSYRGRPAAIGSVYRWHHPLVVQPTLEFVSLTTSELQAREADDVLWRARTPGVSYEVLADAPSVGDAAATRLRQMRTLAARFTVELADDREQGGAESRKLRLLNQPVHRFNSAEQKILDGAIFAFVEGTDPDVWLLLEADDAKVWRYALARMNSSALAVSLDHKVVRRFDKIHEAWENHDAVYTLINFTPSDSADAPTRRVERPGDR